jgi:hypothetical protein
LRTAGLGTGGRRARRFWCEIACAIEEAVQELIVVVGSPDHDEIDTSGAVGQWPVDDVAGAQGTDGGRYEGYTEAGRDQ